MATVAELQEEAAGLDIEGRSSMNKAELEDAIAAVRDVPSNGDAESPGTDWWRDVSAGSFGVHVTLIQAALRLRGYQVQIDGNAGRQTEAAIAAFEVDYGLEPHGVIDSPVWAILSR